MTKATTNVDRRMIDKLTAAVLKSFIDGGVINPSGKNSAQLVDEIIKILGSPAYTDWELVSDHTEDILKHARTFRRLKEHEFACLFYALWFEHKLNDFMFSLAYKKGLPLKDIESLLRESSYRAKSSWLLRIFGVRPLNLSHANLIMKLMEIRNSFVHYKWKPKNEQAIKEIEVIVNEVEKTIKYLRYFEVHHLARMPEKRVRKMLRQRA